MEILHRCSTFLLAETVHHCSSAWAPVPLIVGGMFDPKSRLNLGSKYIRCIDVADLSCAEHSDVVFGWMRWADAKSGF
jgi:hypothetical protein